MSRMVRFGPFADQAEARAFIAADGRDPAWLAAHGSILVTFTSDPRYWVDMPSRETVDQNTGEIVDAKDHP